MIKLIKEKPAWEKQKGESSKAYQRFLAYMELPPEKRSLEKAREIINKSQQNDVPNASVSLSSMKTMSVKWSWIERAELHDKHLILKEMEEQEYDFNNTNQKFIEVFKKELDFASDLLEDLMENVADNALSTRINMFNTLMNVLDALYRNYRLACGRSTKISESINEHHVEAEVESTVAEENIFQYSHEEMERIQNIKNMDEETQKFLDEL